MHLTRAWVEIDLGALLRNGATMAARGVPLLPMVKADAYGLGAVRVVRALERLDPWGYGVATVREGVELRENGVERPIVICTPILASDLAAACHARLTPALGRADDVARWAALGGGAWHLSIDTGMSRAGVRWDDTRTLLACTAESSPEGAFTHFHSATLDAASIAEQERRFEDAISHLKQRPPLLHAENSAALARVEHSRWDLARPGVFLYGVNAGPQALVSPEPVVHLRARVVDLRRVLPGESVSYDATYRVTGNQPRRIATLSIGYADGYRRALGNRGTVLLHGGRAPVVGNVTMDMTSIDVTDVECEIGDVATLIGRDGDHSLDLDTVGNSAGISPYELLTGLRGRLTRVYLGEEGDLRGIA